MPTLFVVAGPNGCTTSTLTRMNGFGRTDIIAPEIVHDLGFGSSGRAVREALHLDLRPKAPIMHAALPADT